MNNITDLTAYLRERAVRDAVHGIPAARRKWLGELYGAAKRLAEYRRKLDEKCKYD